MVQRWLDSPRSYSRRVTIDVEGASVDADGNGSTADASEVDAAAEVEATGCGNIFEMQNTETSLRFCMFNDSLLVSSHFGFVLALLCMTFQRQYAHCSKSNTFVTHRACPMGATVVFNLTQLNLVNYDCWNQ